MNTFVLIGMTEELDLIIIAMKGLVDLLLEIIAIVKDDHSFKPALFTSKLDMYNQDKYTFHNEDR